MAKPLGRTEKLNRTCDRVDEVDAYFRDHPELVEALRVKTQTLQLSTHLTVHFLAHPEIGAALGAGLGSLAHVPDDTFLLAQDAARQVARYIDWHFRGVQKNRRGHLWRAPLIQYTVLEAATEALDAFRAHRARRARDPEIIRRNKETGAKGERRRFRHAPCDLDEQFGAEYQRILQQRGHGARDTALRDITCARY
jgi:hypothetical protein